MGNTNLLQHARYRVSLQKQLQPSCRSLDPASGAPTTTCADLCARVRVHRGRGRLTLVRLVLCGLRAFFTRRDDAQNRSGTHVLSMGPLRVHSATGSCRRSVKSTCQATATAPTIQPARTHRTPSRLGTPTRLEQVVGSDLGPRECVTRQTSPSQQPIPWSALSFTFTGSIHSIHREDRNSCLLISANSSARS